MQNEEQVQAGAPQGATTTEVTLDHSHERGIVGSHVLPDETAATNWLEACRNGDCERFVPALRGKAAVEAFGAQPPELGEFNHLPSEANWEDGIRVTGVNEHYGTVPHDGGFVVVMNADFEYAAQPNAAA
jgi:hypothetical protein